MKDVGRHCLSVLRNQIKIQILTELFWNFCLFVSKTYMLNSTGVPHGRTQRGVWSFQTLFQEDCTNFFQNFENPDPSPSEYADGVPKTSPPPRKFSSLRINI